jgi:hypothetical protein
MLVIMPVLRFNGKTAMGIYHDTVSHQALGIDEPWRYGATPQRTEAMD